MTKTDFKNIYEAFMHCDTNKLKKEFAAMYSDNEEQAAAVKEVDRAFARMETVTPKAVNPDEQSIIVVCKGFGDEGDDTVCIEVRDLRNWKEKHTKKSEPISDEMLTFMSTDEIENAVMNQDLPTKYAFELSAWDEILSWKLAPSSIYIYGLEFCLSRVLWEMTFFGVDASGVELERKSSIRDLRKRRGLLMKTRNLESDFRLKTLPRNFSVMIIQKTGIPKRSRNATAEIWLFPPIRTTMKWNGCS